MTGVAMSPEEVLAVLQHAVATVLELPPANVTLQTRLVEDLAADSLAIVEIVEIVEEQLAARTSRAVRLDDEQLDALRTIGDAVDQVLAVL